MTETQELEALFGAACSAVRVHGDDQMSVHSFLMPLRNNNAVTHVHYLHSLRVALLARKIAAFCYMEEKPALMAGALHDIGKTQIPIKTLGKMSNWTPSDQRAMKKHVLAGYGKLRGRFDFTADVMVWHHRFQVNGYPKRMPRPLHDYGHATRLLIISHGRILAIADVYDALHRQNAKFGKPLSIEEIKQKMFEYNPDRIGLVQGLYDKGILGSETLH